MNDLQKPMYIAAPIEGKAVLAIEKIRAVIAEYFGEAWRPNNAPLHITFDHIPEGQDPFAVVEAAKAVADAVSIIPDVQVTSLVQWHPHAKGSLLVLLLNKQDRLSLIADQVRQQLQERGVVVDGDRPFKPHITLGRFKKKVEGISEFIQCQPITGITFTVDCLQAYGALHEPQNCLINN